MLERAFNGGFKEGETQTIIIDDFAYLDTFGYIVSWLYTQNFEALEHEWHVGFSMVLYTIWVLADRLIMPELQNEIMAAIMRMPTKPMGKAKWIYENTSEVSKLRKYFVEGVASTGEQSLLVDDVELDEKFGILPALVEDMAEFSAMNPNARAEELMLEDYFVRVN